MMNDVVVRLLRVGVCRLNLRVAASPFAHRHAGFGEKKFFEIIGIWEPAAFPDDREPFDRLVFARCGHIDS